MRLFSRCGSRTLWAVLFGGLFFFSLHTGGKLLRPELLVWLAWLVPVAAFALLYGRSREHGERRQELARDVETWVQRRLHRWSRKDRTPSFVYPLAPREQPPVSEPPGPQPPEERSRAPEP